MNLKKHSTPLLMISCAAASLSLLTSAGHAQTFSDALAASRWGLDFRHRIELVEEDGFPEDAEASTLRTRLNLKTGSYNGVQALVEFSDVREIGLDDFNAGAGATPERGLLLKVARFDSSSAEIAGATKFWAQFSLALP